LRYFTLSLHAALPICIIRCRQQILRLEAATDSEGRACCDIIMSRELVRVSPRPRAPFQGWRYLPVADAPPDLGGSSLEEGDPSLDRKSTRLNSSHVKK